MAESILQRLTALQDVGDFQGVVEMEREACGSAEALISNSPGHAAAIFKCLAVSFCSLGHLERAIVLFEQTRALAQELGIRSEEGKASGASRVRVPVFMSVCPPLAFPFQ